MPVYQPSYDDDVPPLLKETRVKILMKAAFDRRHAQSLRNLEYEAQDAQFGDLWRAGKATKRWGALVRLAGRMPRNGLEFLAIWLIGLTDGSREVVSRCVDELARLEKVVGGPGEEVKSACEKVRVVLDRMNLPTCCDFTDLKEFLQCPTPPKS